MIKVFSSSGAIAGWVVWKDWPMLWSGIIAAAQLLDATKHVFPFARLHEAASEMTVALEHLYIDPEAEWAEIEAANMPDADIIPRLKGLAKLAVETGLPCGAPLFLSDQPAPRDPHGESPNRHQLNDIPPDSATVCPVI